jgi:WD40 repeat protein
MISSFKAHESESTHIAFANEGKFIVTLSFKEGLKIWDREGHLKGSFTSGKWFHNIAVSRDSKRIALINDKKIEILDTAGKIITSLEGMDDPANAAAFSPDGNFIAAAGSWKSIMIWKKDGTLLNKIDITNHAGHDISFTRDGSALICTINGFPFKGVRY